MKKFDNFAEITLWFSLDLESRLDPKELNKIRHRTSYVGLFVGVEKASCTMILVHNSFTIGEGVSLNTITGSTYRTQFKILLINLVV